MKFLLSTLLFTLALSPQAAAQTKRVAVNNVKVGAQTQTKTRTQTETRTQREIEREAERQAEREERERERQEQQREREREERQREGHEQTPPVERASEADSQVVVTLCLSQGDVIVRGWDKKEVRARAEGAGNVRLLTPNAQPAPRVEVLVADDEETEPDSGDCGSADQVELMAPRGATVNVRTHSGHVDVSDVADARVEALSGDVEVRRVSKAVLISCLSGDVSVSDVSGPVRAVTVSGSVEARNARSLSAGDGFEAKSTSGDVTMEDVKHAQVVSATVSGSLLYTGSLARGGAYDFRTISGDVTMEIPANSSFNIHARVVVSGDIDTDFPVRTTAIGASAPRVAPTAAQPAQPAQPATPMPAPQPNPQPEPMPWPTPPQTVRVRPGKMKPPKEPEQARLDGTVGGGDATVNMSSFSGSLHLRKR